MIIESIGLEVRRALCEFPAYPLTSCVIRAICVKAFCEFYSAKHLVSVVEAFGLARTPDWPELSSAAARRPVLGC